MIVAAIERIGSVEDNFRHPVLMQPRILANEMLLLCVGSNCGGREGTLWRDGEGTVMAQVTNQVFYATTYHPIQAGSIDGTDTAAHDNAIYRALLASSTGLCKFATQLLIGNPVHPQSHNWDRSVMHYSAFCLMFLSIMLTVMESWIPTLRDIAPEVFLCKLLWIGRIWLPTDFPLLLAKASLQSLRIGAGQGKAFCGWLILLVVCCRWSNGWPEGCGRPS